LEKNSTHETNLAELDLLVDHADSGENPHEHKITIQKNKNDRVFKSQEQNL
jgi:hypothetical protein